MFERLEQNYRVENWGGRCWQPQEKPAERINVIKALKDPELLLEAEKGKMDVDPSPGEELEALIRNVMDQPKEVLDRVKKMLEN